MAIKIPSKNIYDKQNPKVRDNVIERIEVGAVEVVPDNEYKTPVYNEKFLYREQANTHATDDFAVDYSVYKDFPLPGEYIYGEAIAYANVVGRYFSGTIKIPKIESNYYISKILAGVEKKEDGETEAQVKYTANCIKKVGVFSVSANIYEANRWEGLTKKDVEIISSSVKAEYDDTKNTSSILQIPIKGRSEAKGSNAFEDYDGNTRSLSVLASIEHDFLDRITNLKNLTVEEISENGKEYYKFDFTVLCGAVINTARYINFTDGSYEDPSEDEYRTVELKGESEYYVPSSIEMTVYGNTIGIDLKEKTVYIPVDDKTSKKVFRVEGNELMQTTNYTTGGTNNALTDKFGVVKTHYENGKETATIRCSISDYYEYNEPFIKRISPSGKDFTSKIAVSFEAGAIFSGVTISTKNGETYPFPITVDIKAKTATVGLALSLSITLNPNESTKKQSVLGNIGSIESYVATADYKMCFDEYDTVIPMVYGADGKDRPLSLTELQQPKEFVVLGTKIFYDGAVWQELYLQEV